MRFTPAAARAATVNDLPLIPTMKLKGLPTTAQTARSWRQRLRVPRTGTGGLVPLLRTVRVPISTSRLCQFRVSFRDRDRNPDVLDPADGRLEQNAKNKKAPAVPYRVIHRVIVTVIVDGWKS
jgi:hypothetical protein